jgi:segregation and condensation protein B
VGRDYEPVKGQWYENVEEDETFRVLSVDEDSELVEIEYLDGDIEELDLDTWHEMDLERIEEPEGWSADDSEEEEEEDEEEDLDDEDDDDWDDDDDEDDEDDEDWDEDEDENQY